MYLYLVLQHIGKYMYLFSTNSRQGGNMRLGFNCGKEAGTYVSMPCSILSPDQAKLTEVPLGVREGKKSDINRLYVRREGG